jgi:hypothetical protein
LWSGACFQLSKYSSFRTTTIHECQQRHPAGFLERNVSTEIKFVQNVHRNCKYQPDRHTGRMVHHFLNVFTKGANKFTVADPKATKMPSSRKWLRWFPAPVAAGAQRLRRWCYYGCQAMPMPMVQAEWLPSSASDRL